MKIRIYLFTWLALLSSALNVPAEPPQLATSFVPKRLTVGDQFVVVLKLTADNDVGIVGPAADSLGPFLVLGQQERTRAHRGRNEHFYELRLAGFKPGSFVLPVFTFMVSQGDRVDTLRSDTLRVVISSVLPDNMTDINDLKAAEAFPNHWLWIIPLGLAALAGLGYWGWRLYLKLRKIREEIMSPLSPWDEALKALDQIPMAEWLDREQYKRYYYTLSEITKRYLERRFGFNAVEQTTTEIISSLKRGKVPERDGFGQFLLQADLVKYAKIVPPRSEMEEALALVRNLVNRTKPAPAADGARGQEEAK